MKNLKLLLTGISFIFSCSTIVKPYERTKDADIIGYLNAKGKVDSIHVAYKASKKFCLMGIGKDEIIYGTHVYEKPLSKKTIKSIYHDFKNLRVKFVPFPKPKAKKSK